MSVVATPNTYLKERGLMADPQVVIEPTYLPFTPDDLLQHFLKDAAGQVKYFRLSAQRYRDFLKSNPDRRGIPLGNAKTACQIEKDERFWTATTLKHLVDSERCTEILIELLSRTFGSVPPINLPDWETCLHGDLKLVLEATLPSPESYKSWIRENVAQRHLIPYVHFAAERDNNRTLEGPTHIDAILINPKNGFSVLFEAKVLSDISYQVSFDMHRNQIARNIDIMLEPPYQKTELLRLRHPDRSLFALLTPNCFRDLPESRYYGYLLRDYKSDPNAIVRDLPHRKDIDWIAISKRIGWLTFEDINERLPGACPWLESAV